MTRGRLEAFSDGVLAVVITLLALDLHASAEGEGSLGHQLATEWPTFAAFVISFFVIGVIWVNHHALVALVGRVDRPLMFYNLLLLFWVTTIPFTTSTLAKFLLHGGWDARLAVLMYGLSMEGMSVGFTLMLGRMLRAGLTLLPVPPADGRRAQLRFGIGLVLYPVVTAIGLFSPIVMLVLLALLTVWYITERTPIFPQQDQLRTG